MLIGEAFDKIGNFDIVDSSKKQLCNLLSVSIEDFATFSYFKTSKIHRHNFTFHSQSCDKVKQRNSFTILLQKDFNGCGVIQVQYFLQVSNSNVRKTFAIENGFKKVSKAQGNEPHLDVIELRRYVENSYINPFIIKSCLVYKI